MKTLAQDTIIANARFFGGNVDLVPKQVQSVSCLKVNNDIFTLCSLQGIAYGGWQRKKHETQNLQKRKNRNTSRQALTVGVGTVMDAKEVLVLITGANKAFALYKVSF